MFKIVLIILQCLTIRLINSQVFNNNQLYDPCNASFIGNDWLSKALAKGDSSRGFGNLNDTRFYSSQVISKTSKSETADVSFWLDFPILPIVFANSSNSIPEGRCKNHVKRYLRDLAASKLWAVQMFDSSTKYPDGVIYGNTKHLGNFDQCYNLKAKLPPDEDDQEVEDEIEGRYCLIRFRYQRKNVVVKSPESFTLDFDPNLSVWDAIDDRGDFRRVKRNSVYMALCVPASCNAKEVEIALGESVKKLADDRGVRLEMTLKPAFSQAKSDLPKNFSTGAKIFCLIIAGLFLLVVGSSWYDSSLYSAEEAIEQQNGPTTDIFLCFSARRNLQSIFVAPGSHPGLECIHFIRFFFMAGVIFGHRFMQYYGFPVANSDYLEKSYGASASMTVFNGTIIVDGFFGLGGLLLAYGLLQELDRSNRMSFVALIAIRFLRLTPLYMLVVFFHATVMPLMGSGPYWETRIGSDGEYCSKNWWTNLLYINNYVNPTEICIFQSWYLSVDYHLYIMGLFVLWTFWKLPRKLGYTFLGVLIAIGTAIPFVITYTQNIQPLFLGLPFMGDARKDPYFIAHYIKPHTRIAPYMVGVLAGVIVYDHKKWNWRLSKTWSRLLFLLLAVGLTITSQSLGAKYYDPNSVLEPLGNAAYAGFHRAGFAMGICSIVVLITIGDGLDFPYNFMTPHWAAPLARLTYAAFLVHNIIQGYVIGVTRTPRVFSVLNAFWDVVPDLVFTFTLSLLLSIGVEGPIRKIEKYMLTKRRSRDYTERSSSNGLKKTN